MSTPENPFSSKMKTKTPAELDKIIANPSLFTPEAVEAAKAERGLRPDASSSSPVPAKGEEAYSDIVKTFKKESHFAWTPKHTISYTSALPFKLIHKAAEKAFNDLDWEVVYLSDEEVVATRKAKNLGLNRSTEKIRVIIQPSGIIQITSESLGNEVWDMGRNAKRAQLFLHVFKKEEALFESPEIQHAQLQEIEKAEQMSDYIIPDTLPKPPSVKDPNIFAYYAIALSSSLALGAFFGITTHYLYIIMLFESGVGIALGYLLLKGVKWSGFEDFNNLKVSVIFSTIFIVLFAQFSQYLKIISEHQMDLTFIQFIQMRLEAGFHFRDTNTGWVGWVVVWALQILLIYLFGIQKLSTGFLAFLVNRVPQEVIDFTIYHFIQGRSEQEVRNELSRKGWTERKSQDMAIDAVAGLREIQEIQKS